VVPIVIISRHHNKKGNDFATRFAELAKENGLQIDKHDFWNRIYGIGIDSKAKKLLYIKKKPEGEEEAFAVDLQKIASSRILKDSRIVKPTNAEVIDALALQLRFKDFKIPDRNLEFYNSAETLSLSNEFLLINQWTGIVDKIVKY
ncbi:MAG: hypothetical protein LBN27_07475, partial [Prevotellaceae bacterium]|nr:hypothetical protein [Prevotellaceae bacterium]